jgi:hypothetical protein
MARFDVGLGAPGGACLPAPGPARLTLLDLVAAVAEFANGEAEVVAVIHHLLESGRVILVGQFLDRHLLTN